MSQSELRPIESIDCLDDRTKRALTECMIVVEESDDLYEVYSGDHSYTVDLRGEGRCQCADAEWSLDPEEQCKHQRRCELEATGERGVPADVDRDDLDALLLKRLADPDAPARFGAPSTADEGDSAPRDVDATDDVPVIATDGGVVTEEAGDAGDDRPDDCECWDDELPCWPCYNAGFVKPNPAAEVE